MSPLRLGLTGNIGSGKSTVARLLAARGAAVIDADRLAREATADPAVLARIERELGPGLVREGRLDRAATARRVFADEAARGALNAIVHPWVAARRDELERALLAAPDPPPVIVHDVPLLYEAGLDGMFDAVVVVTAPLEARLARVAERDGLPLEEARARDAAQLPLEEKAARAEHVLDNAGDEAALATRVDELWRRLGLPERRRGGAGGGP